MAFAFATLYNISGAPPGSALYLYRTADDNQAAVEVAGYFNNGDDGLVMAAGDIIMAYCTDGLQTLRVSAVSSGSVTTQALAAGGPKQVTDDTSTATDTLGYGHTERGTGSASKFFIPAPFAGAKFEFYVGATAGTGSSIELITATTGQTLNATGDTTITIGVEGTMGWVQLEGKSSTRWVIRGLSSTALTS